MHTVYRKLNIKHYTIVEVVIRANFELKFELAKFTDYTLFAWAQLLSNFQIVA